MNQNETVIQAKKLASIAAIAALCGVAAACTQQPSASRYPAADAPPVTTSGDRNPGTSADQQIVPDSPTALPGNGGTRSGVPTNATGAGTSR